MKIKLFQTVRIALILGIEFTSMDAIAAPDPLFKAIIPSVRRELPQDMVVRLPKLVRNVYKEDSSYQGKGTKVYATSSQYRPDIDRGSYIIMLSRTPDCNTTSCGVGYIAVQRDKPSIHDSSSGAESKDKENVISIRSGLNGYYFYARAGSAGERHNVYWQQNGLYFHLNFRGYTKDEVIKMANSMSTEKAI